MIAKIERRRALFLVIATLVAIAGVAIILKTLASTKPVVVKDEVIVKLVGKKVLPSIDVRTNAVKNGVVQRAFTCDGEGIPPKISWKPYDDVKCYAVIVLDPDAPIGTFYHLIEVVKLANNTAKALKVYPNSAGYEGWFPVCPPHGSTHRYYFVVVGLKICETPKDTATLFEMIKKDVVAVGYVIGKYGR